MAIRRAVAFLTPVGGASPPSPAAVAWFPVVGAMLGLAVGAVWWVAGEAWHPAVAASLAIAADLALTGLLHVDGLVDSADGLLAPMDRERRLAVMAEPGVGAFGVGTAVTVLLCRFAALATMRPSVWLIAGLWCGSRTVMAVGLRTVRYARPGGLATAFQGGPAAPIAGYGLAAATGLVATSHLGLGPALAAVAAVLLAGALVCWLAVRRIGGFTGDVLGAAGLVGETAGLVVAAARW